MQIAFFGAVITFEQSISSFGSNLEVGNEFRESTLHSAFYFLNQEFSSINSSFPSSKAIQLSTTLLKAFSSLVGSSESLFALCLKASKVFEIHLKPVLSTISNYHHHPPPSPLLFLFIQEFEALISALKLTPNLVSHHAPSISLPIQTHDFISNLLGGEQEHQTKTYSNLDQTSNQKKRTRDQDVEEEKIEESSPALKIQRVQKQQKIDSNNQLTNQILEEEDDEFPDIVV